MVQKNSTIRPVRSKNTVVEFNLDGLNGKPRNGLFVCTARTHPQRGGTSKYKGVSKDTGLRLTQKEWRAYIWLNKAKVSLGCFTYEKDAARAYDQKAIELYGELAWTNAKYFGDLSNSGK